MAVNNTLTAVIPTLYAMGLKSLRSNSVMPRLVNTDFGAEAREKGEIIQIPLPSAMAVSDVQPGAYAPDPQNVSPLTAKIPMDYWKEAPFTLSEKELAQVINGIVPIQLSAAVEALATYINASILGLYTGVYGFVGTPGTTPYASDLHLATGARRVLGIQKAPTSNRRMVLNPDAEANALGLPAFQYYLNAGTDETIKEGVIGRKIGFDWFMDQQIPYQIAGTQTGTVTANGAQAIAQGSTDGGRTGTVSIAAAASSGATYNVGDILTFAGDTQTYVVLAPVTIAASANGVVNISPALKVAKVGGEAVTLQASHVVNLAFHRDAFGFASRPLKEMNLTDDPDRSYTVSDPVSGLTMRLSYREEFHRTRFAFDVLWGVGLIRPELAVRIAG